MLSWYCFTGELTVNWSHNLNLNLWLIRMSNTSGRFRDVKIPEYHQSDESLRGHSVNPEMNGKLCSNASFIDSLASESCYYYSQIISFGFVNMHTSKIALELPTCHNSCSGNLLSAPRYCFSKLSKQAITDHPNRNVYLALTGCSNEEMELQITNLKLNFSGGSLLEVCAKINCSTKWMNSMMLHMLDGFIFESCWSRCK